MKVLWLLSLRLWRERPLKNILTLLAIALSVALIISVRLVAVSTSQGFHDSIEAMMGAAQLSIHSAKTGFPESVLEKVEALDGIKFAVPVIEIQTFYKDGSGEQALMVLGLDLLKEGSARVYQTTQGEDFLADPLVFLNQADSIVVSEVFAKQHQLQLNSPLILNTPTGVVTLTVRGIIKAEGPGQAFGGSLAIMDIDGARRTFKKEQKIDRIDLVLHQPQQADLIKARLEKELGPAFQILPVEGQVTNLVQITQAFTSLLDLMASFSFLIAGFLVYNTTTIALVERKKEIATLIAMGLDKKRAVIAFLSEVLFLGVIASGLGLLIGKYLGQWMIHWAAPSMSNQFMMPIHLPNIPLTLNWFLGALFAGIGISFISALIPTYQASQIKPIVVLKNNEETLQTQKNIFLKLVDFSHWFFLVFLIFVLLKKINSNIHIQSLEIVFYLVSLVFFTPKILLWMLKGVSFLTQRVAPLSLMYLAVQSILRTKRELFINIMSLTICFSMVANIEVVQRSFYSSIMGWFERSFSADLALTQGLNLVSAQVQAFSPSLLKPLDQITELPTPLSSQIFGMQINETRFQNQSIKIKAFDQPQTAQGLKMFDLQNNKNANALDLFNEKNCFISDNMASHFNLKINDVIEIPTPMGPLSLVIKGVVTDFISPVGTVYLSRKIYQEMWQDELISFAFLYAHDSLKNKDLKKIIDQSLGSSGIIATQNHIFLEQARASLNQSFAPLKIIEWVVLIVAFLGMLNSNIIRTLQKAKEFAVFRSVGLNKIQWACLLFFESALLSVFTALISSVLSLFIVWFWMAEVVSEALGWKIHPALNFAQIANHFWIAMLMAFLSTLFPLLKLRNKGITEVLRND